MDYEACVSPTMSFFELKGALLAYRVANGRHVCKQCQKLLAEQFNLNRFSQFAHSHTDYVWRFSYAFAKTLAFLNFKKF